jgi:hypothetical protein
MSLIYQYSDGANNSFHIWPNRIVYHPMKPQFSSSGMYDGGEPADKALTEEQFVEIKMLVDAAIACTDEHLEERPKGSGLLKTEDGTMFVLVMNGAAKNRLEAFLRSLIL